MITAISLKWTNKKNPVLGKLKLQSMERANIFYEEWLHFIHYGAGVLDWSNGLMPLYPYTLNKNTAPKKVDVPPSTTVVNGFYEDTYGRDLKRDIAYTIKIMLWVETEEEAEGVVFDFQEETKG